MSRIVCEIQETEIGNDDGIEVPSIVATCPLCDHQTQSFGTGDSSITRCLVLMRKQCPNRKHNFYVAAGG